MPDFTAIRETLLGVLSWFARVDWQIDYPYSTGEMYCQWFDDVYHPESAIWGEVFSEHEQKAMESFSDTLGLYSDSVTSRGLCEVMGTKEWDEIISSANNVLTVFAQNGTGTHFDT